jgi:hypothetical protein
MLMPDACRVFLITSAGLVALWGFNERVAALIILGLVALAPWRGPDA